MSEERPLSEEELGRVLTGVANLSRDLFLIYGDDDHNALRGYIAQMDVEVRRLRAERDAARGEYRQAIDLAAEMARQRDAAHAVGFREGVIAERASRDAAVREAWRRAVAIADEYSRRCAEELTEAWSAHLKELGGQS